MVQKLYAEFEDHPNRVKLEDLKDGDFFVILDTDRFEDRYKNVSMEKVWRCSSEITYHSEWSRSIMGMCVSMARHVIGLQTSFQYLWFGKDPLIIKLPKKQQTIYRRFYDSLRKNEDVHELGWSEWRRNRKR